MKKLKKILVYSVVAYLFCLGFLYLQQRDMMYHPNKSRPDVSKLEYFNGEIARVETVDGLSLDGWYFSPTKASKPTILFFHGNAGNIEHRLFKANEFIKHGYGVLLAEYRGFGGNAGNPTEQGFYSDARAYLKWLRDIKDISSENIVIYGESIGTGVAVQIASENKFIAVVLEAPYSSTVDIALSAYPIFPIEALMKDQYRSLDKIVDINAPLLIVHGTKDIVIPIKLSKKLYEEAVDPKVFIGITEAGHNDLYEFGAFEEILKFIEQ